MDYLFFVWNILKPMIGKFECTLVMFHSPILSKIKCDSGN